MAKELGLTCTLRPRGRPTKKSNKHFLMNKLDFKMNIMIGRLKINKKIIKNKLLIILKLL